MPVRKWEIMHASDEMRTPSFGVYLTIRYFTGSTWTDQPVPGGKRLLVLVPTIIGQGKRRRRGANSPARWFRCGCAAGPHARTGARKPKAERERSA
eukprot:5154166-Pleurochrysis_carterae.AAC.1